MKNLTDPNDPTIWQQEMEAPHLLLVHTRGGFRGNYDTYYELIEGVWLMSAFRHPKQEPFATIVLRWGNPPYLVRHREGPLPPWRCSLISHLMETLTEKPIFDRDHVGNAMVVMGSVLGFPCVEVRLADNRPHWPSVPCVVVSGKEFDPFISIEAKGKLFPTNFETGKSAPYTVELGGETCYVCERSGNALVVRAIDFDLNS